MKTVIKNLLALSIASIITCQTAHATVPLSDYEYVGYQGQKVAAKKGTFIVPENRAKPNGKQLELTFVKFPTTSKNPGNPIVYLSGGPGGSATGTAKRKRFEMFKQLTQVSDVILFDQRGTGLSNQNRRCAGTQPDLASPTIWQEAVTQVRKDIKDCVTHWQEMGIDLSGYNTKESAADLVALSKALGSEKINLWGISYGSHLAFTTAKYHPQIIDKMVLASLEGLSHTIKSPQRVDDLITQVSDLLASREDTKKKYPNLKADLSQVMLQLKAEPQIVTTRIMGSKELVKVGISDVDIQFTLSYVFLVDPQHLAKLPRIVADMKAGNFAEIGSYVGTIKSRAGSYNPMSVAMDSASGIDKARWQQVLQEAKTSLVGRTTNFPYPDINDLVPVDDLGDNFRQEITNSTIPSLFVAGTFDGRTLYQSQVELAKGFKNGSVLTVEGGGHNVYMTSPKIGEKVVQFLQGKSVPSQTIQLAALDFE